MAEMASASHILVNTEEECLRMKKQIEAGANFSAMARKYSLCPSGKDGGDLGEFPRGAMVQEFDDIVFNAEVGKVHGPVKTEFGYHLIYINNRS